MRENIGRLLLQKFQLIENRLLKELNSSEFAPISKAESMIFASLRGNESSLSDIAKALGISRQAVHKTVSELVKRDLLILHLSEKNKSAKLVTLSAKGEHCVQFALMSFKRIEKDICNEIGQEQMEMLINILSKNWHI